MAVNKEDVLRWLDALQNVVPRETAGADRPGFRRRRRRFRHQSGPRLHGGEDGAVREASSGPPGGLSEHRDGAHQVHGRQLRAPPRDVFSERRSDVADKSELGPADVVALFQAGVEGMQQRGKAERGDKTMMDAWLPAVDAMRECAGGRRRPDGSPGPGRGGG